MLHEKAIRHFKTHSKWKTQAKFLLKTKFNGDKRSRKYTTNGRREVANDMFESSQPPLFDQTLRSVPTPSDRAQTSNNGIGLKPTPFSVCPKQFEAMVAILPNV